MPRFFSRSKQVKLQLRQRLIFYFSLLFTLIALAGVIKIFHSAPFFQVNEIVVIGVPERTEEYFLQELKTLVSNTFFARIFGEYHFFAWKESLALSDPQFADIRINKKILDRSVYIHITPRERFGIWCALTEGLMNSHNESRENNCWWFDSLEGKAFEAALEAKGQLIIKIDEERTFSITPGEDVLPVDQFKNFKLILEILRKTHVSVGNMSLDREHEEIQIKSGRTNIIFNLRFDPLINLAGFQELLAKKPIDAYSIIDLTVKNKVYVTE